MTTVVAIAGEKGGAGKSTLAACLADEGMERGLRVLVVDADPQGTLRVWGELGAEGGHRVPTIVAMGATMHRPEGVPAIAGGFDLVVIDCPPRHGDIQRSAIMAADRVLIPVGPGTDVLTMGGTLALIEAARVLRPELVAHLVVTRVQPRTAIAASVRRSLEGIDLPRLDTTCAFRVAYQEAVICGRGVTTYEPQGAAAREVRRLFTELFGAPARRRKEPARATQTTAVDPAPQARARGAAS